MKKIFQKEEFKNIFRKYFLNKIYYYKWIKNGYTDPPPHIVKQMTIKKYQDKYRYDTIVETGTYLGDMVEAQKHNFKKIYSIELSANLYKMAVERFKDDFNVTIIQGDSGKVLPSILSNIHKPVIFWLDGHYSAGNTAKGNTECPILEEIEAIFKNRKFNDILLIDDARCFIGVGDYPTIDQLTAYIKNKNSKYNVEVKHDIIRCTI